MPATGAESLPAGYAVAARHDDGLRGRGGAVRYHAAWRVDPDRARDLRGHARGIRCVGRALIHDPRGARIGLPEFLHDADIGRVIDFRSADRARRGKMEQAGVGERLEERLRQFAVRVDRVRVRANERCERAGGFER
ncbi:hypothetical protein D3C83_20900 [compost metagenome]